MKTNLLELIDFAKVDTLLEGFNKSTGFVTAILDLQGNVLSRSGWRRICTDFHRIHPESSEKCTVSDTVLASKMAEGENYHFYRCLNGLVDVAVPIIINGEHIANLFSGQFFFEKPDFDYFQKQAEEYGFDNPEYLKALAEVPVLSKEKVKDAMDFLLNMTQLISETTFQKMEELQLNEALRKSEERFRGTLDHMLEGCQILGFDWKYIYLNRAAEIHNRRPNSELLGKRYMDMWPGIENTVVYKIIEEVLKQRVSRHIENEFIFPDGYSGWFDLSIQPIPEGVFILSIDISERKKAEKALQISEEKYRLISDNTDDWIYWIRPDGFIYYVSPACERVTGYSPEDFISHPDLHERIVFEADRELVSQHTLISSVDSNVHQIEFRIVSKEGDVRWISHTCSPLYDDAGVYLGRRGTNRNITERKQQQELLFESEFRFNNLYENGPFGMVMADFNFRFKEVNPAFVQILGYDKAELLNFTFRDVTHPDDINKDLINIQKLLKREISIYKTEKRYLRKDGQVIWGSLTVTTAYDSEGAFLYFLGIIEDITWRKEAEIELKKSKQLLSETEIIGKVGGWEFNIDTFTQTWTDEVYRIHEVDPDFNPNVDNGINFYTPESQPVIEEAVKRIIETGEPFDLELDIITARGNVRKVHSIGKADFQNRRVYGFFQDITDRKQAELKIRELNERIATATRSAQVGIWDWDIKCNSLTWDEQMYILYGLKKEDFAGAYEAWLSGLHPDDREFSREETNKALTGEKDYDTEFRIVWPDGTVRHCKARGEVFRNEIGEPVRMVGVNFDITEDKLKDEKIRAKDLEFRKLSANVPDLIFQFTRKPDGSYYVPIASEGIRNIFGCAPEEVVDDFSPIGSVIYPEDFDRVISDIEFSATNMTPFTCEFRVLIPGREIQWIYSRSTPELLPDGSITWYGFNTDITQKKKAEEALRYSEALLKEVGKIAQIGGWEYDVEKNNATWTSEIATIYDFDTKAVDGETFTQKLFVGDSLSAIRLALKEAVELSKPFDLELEILTAQGRRKWTRNIGQPVSVDGKVVKISGATQDITKRRMVESALRESEAKFRMLLESIPIPVTHVSMAGDIMFRNERFLQIIGYTREEVPTISEWWVKAYPDKTYRDWVKRTWDKAVQKAITKGTDIDPVEYIVHCKDGTDRVLIISGINIDDNLLITFIDISDRKKAEEDIRKLNETLEQRVAERTSQLESANKELEAFSYSVSHDLRAPLRHINGFVDLLKERFGDDLPDKARHYLTTIADASKQMGTLIDDLLHFSRTSRQEVHRVKINMNALLKEVIDKTKPDREGRKITWKIPDLPDAYGDYALIKQVWVNLIDNAVKYTRKTEKAIITIESKEEDKQLVYTVRDNGVGFDMKYSGKLFGVFQRLHSAADFEGTGIGLANVQRIISKHKGKIWVEAELGKGAAFYFTLPINQEEEL